MDQKAQIIRQLQALYDYTRLAKMTADEHDHAKALANAVAAALTPPPPATAEPRKDETP